MREYPRHQHTVSPPTQNSSEKDSDSEYSARSVQSEEICTEYIPVTSLPSGRVSDEDSTRISAKLDECGAGVTECEDRIVEDKKTVRESELCSCGQPYKLLQYKKKVRVRNARGVFTTISKNETSLRCLDCSDPSSSQVQDDKKPRITTVLSKGGGLKQMRLGDYYGKLTRPK